jgi:PAS domain S-box-containing protein
LIDDGHFSGSIHVAHDITARKLAEESMRASEMRWKFALEGAGDGVWDWNKQADKVFFSHQWKTMLGYTDDEIGNSVSEWDSRIHPEDRHACYSELEKHFRGESEIYQSEHRILCKDGCYKWILDRGKVVERDIHGQPLRVIGTHTDISYRKEAEESILRAKDAADAANQSKSRFISVIAHEFHTPLGLLAISVDILDRYWDRLSEEERAAQHGQIRSAACQMSQLIDSVLAFNRQEAEGANAAPKFHDISQLCRTIAEEVETVWSDNHLFHISISSECGTYQLDEALFRRILVNLLTNAFRFTPSGRSVTFIANRKEDRLIIEVRDAGIGIPQGDQERIFQAFYRCSNVESRPGLGLGLSILNESLKKMNGDISITSSVGEGTTFRVEIPLNDESRENRHEFNTYN